MSTGSKLIELRNGIDETYQKLMRENDGTALFNQSILDRIKADLRAKISECDSALIDMALTKLLNDVSRRRRKVPSELVGPDLFGQYRGVPQILSMGRGVKRATSDLSVNEALKWLSKHPPKPAKDTHSGLRALVDRCLEEGALGDEKLGTAIERLES